MKVWYRKTQAFPWIYRPFRCARRRSFSLHDAPPNYVGFHRLVTSHMIREPGRRIDESIPAEELGGVGAARRWVEQDAKGVVVEDLA